MINSRISLVVLDRSLDEAKIEVCSWIRCCGFYEDVEALENICSSCEHGRQR